MWSAAVDIVTFESLPEPEAAAPDPARLLDGAPRQTVQNVFTDASGQFFAGVWTSTPGRWRIAYTESEFCHLLEGRVRLSSSSGREWRFGPGDTFIVPAGFEGVWEVEVSARKLYAIFEAAQSQ